MCSTRARRPLAPARCFAATCLALAVSACAKPERSAESPEGDAFASAPASDPLPSDPRNEPGSEAEPRKGGVAPGTAVEDRPPGVIYRSELVRATHGGRPPYLMQQLGPEAYRPNGRFIGWKITRVWPGDPELCAPGCDLRPGDVVVAVNGRPIEYPEHLSDLLAKIDSVEKLEVQMLRGGKLAKKSWSIAER